MPGDGDGSITRWIAGVKAGDPAAAQPLWERYFARMVDMARARLRASPRRGHDAASDEEDAALSAFDSLCAGLARGRFPQLSDRDNLWRLLVVISTRKVRAQARRRLRRKRGAGRVRRAGDLEGPESDDGLLARAVGSEPTPELAVMAAEEYRRLLDRLDDDVLRRVGVLRMEGYTTDAVAEPHGCARRTVARRLPLIRRILAADPDAESPSALSPSRDGGPSSLRSRIGRRPVSRPRSP
jgi:DNA-directed RNA polymerase specialized sigma24 family protein